MADVEVPEDGNIIERLMAQRDEWMARALVAEAASIEVMDELGHLRGRPWLFQPGDRVLCLLTLGTTLKMLDGVVLKVQIPGPIQEDKTVYVQCDNEQFRLAWWNPDQVERIG